MSRSGTGKVSGIKRPSFTSKSRQSEGPSVERTTEDLLREIVSSKGEALFSDDQVTDLLSLQFPDGTKVFESETNEGRETIFHFVGSVMESTFEETYDDLKYTLEMKVQNYSEYFFASKAMKNSRHKADLFLEISRGKYDVGEGSFKCSKCGSNETVAIERQTRSADEPMTIFVTCIHCNNHWRS